MYSKSIVNGDQQWACASDTFCGQMSILENETDTTITLSTTLIKP